MKRKKFRYRRHIYKRDKIGNIYIIRAIKKEGLIKDGSKI